jgi:hypothetical protein
MSVSQTKMTTRQTSEATSSAVRCVEPSAFSSVELGEFQACVLSGGEVDARGLMRRLKQSFRLSSVHVGENLVAVGGLKNPGIGYRSDISKKSGIDLPESRFPLELGGSTFRPAHEGKSFPAWCVNHCSRRPVGAESSRPRITIMSTCIARWKD